LARNGLTSKRKSFLQTSIETGAAEKEKGGLAPAFLHAACHFADQFQTLDYGAGVMFGSKRWSNRLP
jgi:hypothetical protein